MVKRSMRTLEEKANTLLRDYDTTEPPVPVSKIAEHLGAEIREAPGDSDVSGMLFRDGRSIVIGINTAHHDNRQRFTIAHEIGHLVLHRSPVYLDTVHHRDTRAALGTDDEEIEANQFAASLLMPASFIRRDLEDGRFNVDDLHAGDDVSLRKLAERYKVSTRAMTLRLVNLHFLPENVEL